MSSMIPVYRVPSITVWYSIRYKMKCEYEKSQIYMLKSI